MKCGGVDDTITSSGSEVPADPADSDWDVEDGSTAGKPNSAVSVVEFDIVVRTIKAVRLITCGGNHRKSGVVNVTQLCKWVRGSLY